MSTAPVVRQAAQSTISTPMQATTATIVPSRGISYSAAAGEFIAQAAIIADCIPEEHHTDTSEITRHPVEQGSTITDNAVDQFPEITLTYGWWPGSKLNPNQSLTFLEDLYAQFLALKTSKTLLNVYTGKRAYVNCLIQSITETTDPLTETVLLLRIGLVAVQIVATQTITVQQAATALAQPERAQGTIQRGTVQPSLTPLASLPSLDPSLFQ